MDFTQLSYSVNNHSATSFRHTTPLDTNAIPCIASAERPIKNGVHETALHVRQEANGRTKKPVSPKHDSVARNWDHRPLSSAAAHEARAVLYNNRDSMTSGCIALLPVFAYASRVRGFFRSMLAAYVPPGHHSPFTTIIECVD